MSVPCPSALFTAMRMPCCSAIQRAIESPSPEPPVSFVREESTR